MDRIEYRQIMATDFGCYDNTQDARFESMRNYPRRVQLYRKHKDLMKEYEHKVQYYRRYQKMFATETRLKKQKVEGRFIRMIKHTLNESPLRSDNLKFSYHTWTGQTPQTRESERIVNGTLQTASPRGLTGLSRSVASRSLLQRLPSQRSVSVDNVPHVTSTESQIHKTMGKNRTEMFVQTPLSSVRPEKMVRSMTAIDQVEPKPISSLM